MYKVIEFFTDLQDGDHPYQAGDLFPRDGVNVSAERILELSGPNNKRGKALIMKIGGEEPAKENKEPAPKKRTSRKKKEE